MSKGKFIVITGLDGSGTTSLGKKLANEDPIGYYLQTPHQIYSEVKDLFTDNIREQFPVAHLYFYLSAVICVVSYNCCCRLYFLIQQQ